MTIKNTIADRDLEALRAAAEVERSRSRLVMCGVAARRSVAVGLGQEYEISG